MKMLYTVISNLHDG